MSKDNTKKTMVEGKTELTVRESAAKHRATSASKSRDDGERLKAVNETLLSILKETSTSDGVNFFKLLLERLADVLGFRYAMVTEVIGEEQSSAKSLVFYANGEVVDNFEYSLVGTPCSEVVDTGLCIYPSRARELFPEDEYFKDMDIESYVGVPLVDSKGVVIGMLIAFDTKPIEDVEFCLTIFTIFALRAGFELERVRLESERQRSAELLEAIMDNCPAAIYIKDPDGRLLFVNRWLSRLPGFNKKEAVGLTDYDILPKDVVDRFRENDILTLESGSAQTFEEVLRHSDGIEQIFLTVKFPLPSVPGAICGISTDITDRKRMESEIVRARKLESIGTLAGGIAHDLNNVLLGVLGNASIAKAHLRTDDKVWALLDDIEKSANRVKVVTRQLLTFSKSDVMIKELVEAGQLIRNTSTLLLKGHDIELDIEIPEGLFSVEVDEVMIGQVLEHIILNAAHSMPDGGTVKLKAGNTTLAEGELPPLVSGKYVRIDIEDNGAGIPNESLPLVFDPFFTTKERASGLGLSVSYSIVRKHGGSVTVESKLNEGSVFSIYLPAVEPASHETISRDDKVELRGKVLVMDDEDIIRDASGEMLQMIGLEADFALDGMEAIEMYKASKEAGTPYIAVIMDLTIPNGLGGKEAMERLVKIDPNARVVVSSGYSGDPIMENFKAYGFSAVLIKPYKFDEFSRVVKSVIIDSD